MDAVAHRRVGRQGGPATRELCDAILAERPHPEQGYRSCLGILRLGKRYGDERLEAACGARSACARARTGTSSRSSSTGSIASLATDEPTSLSLTHENVRGRDYYH